MEIKPLEVRVLDPKTNKLVTEVIKVSISETGIFSAEYQNKNIQAASRNALSKKIIDYLKATPVFSGFVNALIVKDNKFEIVSVKRKVSIITHRIQYTYFDLDNTRLNGVMILNFDNTTSTLNSTINNCINSCFSHLLYNKNKMIASNYYIILNFKENSDTKAVNELSKFICKKINEISFKSIEAFEAIKTEFKKIKNEYS